LTKQLLKTKTNPADLTARAKQLVTENQDLIERVADALFEAETQVLSGDQVRALKRS
jgi:ATP-dependent Zn protease